MPQLAAWINEAITAAAKDDEGALDASRPKSATCWRATPPRLVPPGSRLSDRLLGTGRRQLLVELQQRLPCPEPVEGLERAQVRAGEGGML